MLKYSLMDASDWINLATAIGTVSAAVFAGVAAWTAGQSAAASRQLVTVERQRDDAERHAAVWRQARRVTVETRGRERLDQSGNLVATDVSVVVMNASADPIFNTRIKIVSGDGARWGPQLLGNLPPGHSIEVIARIRSESPEFNGFARFADVEGRGWVSNSMSAAEADNDVNRWIEEGREFAARELLPHERGTMDRSDQRDMPDFDAWAVHIVDDLEE